MILNPTKALLSLSFPPSLYCKKSLSVWLRGQKFNISPSLGPFLCLTSFTTVRETFFPLLTTTSLLLSLRHSKLLSSLFRQPLCLLICSLRCCFAAALRRGSPKCLSSFFFLVRTLMERRLAPFLPGRLSWCPAVKCCGRTTKTTTQWNALQFPSAKLFWLLNRFYSSRQSGTFHSCRPSPAGPDRLNSSCHSRSAAFPPSLYVPHVEHHYAGHISLV